MKKPPRYRFLAVLLCLACVAPACASDDSEGDASERADVGGDAGADTSNDGDERRLCDPLFVCTDQFGEYTEQLESDVDCPETPPEIGTDCGSRDFQCYYCRYPERAESIPDPEPGGVNCFSGSWRKGGVVCTSL